MDQEAAAGTRVQIRFELLAPGERAPGLPGDTARLPYLVRVRGILTEPSSVGAPGTIRTATGRTVTGEVEVIEPADTHTFGRPVAALVATADAIRSLSESLR